MSDLDPSSAAGATTAPPGVELPSMTDLDRLSEELDTIDRTLAELDNPTSAQPSSS